MTIETVAKCNICGRTSLVDPVYSVFIDEDADESLTISRNHELGTGFHICERCIRDFADFIKRQNL